MRKNKQPSYDSEGNMTLTGHLKEMRNRIAVVLVVFLIGAVICFSYADDVVNLLIRMGSEYNYTFVYLAPQELLMQYFSISLIGGLVLDVPVIGYEAYAFAGPGLRKKEKSFMMLGLIFGLFFFCIGVAFAYFVTMPFMLRFLISFSNFVAVTASISIKEYISFILTVFIIFGVVFELPVIAVILTALGLVKPQWLVKARKVMIVLIFLLAAIITPPDIVSQIMVAIPIVLLYEVSIFLSRFVYKLRKK